jgi:hypothetical protein
VDEYAELYRLLGLGDVPARMAVGQLDVPTEVDLPPALGFPPALLPLWFSDGVFVGFWKHWFSTRSTTIVRHYAYEGWITEEWARSFDQLACMVILTAIDLDDGVVEDETRQFAQAVGLEQDLPLLNEIWRDRGWPRIIEHSAFGDESPRRFLPSPDAYRGDFPHADMEMSVPRLRNTCTYEARGTIGGRIDPMENAGRFQARLASVGDIPPWLQTIDQSPVFDQLLEAGDYLGAWMSLNSVGWTYGQAKTSIRKLAAAAGDEEFQRLAEVWSSCDHVDSEEY